MTLLEFVNLYNGSKVGDGQCVALIKLYESEVLGLTPVAVGNAHAYYDDYENQEFLNKNFDRITYNGTNIPQTRRYNCMVNKCWKWSRTCSNSIR